MIVNVRSLMRPSYPTGTRDTGSVGGVTIINIDVIVIFMHHYIVVTVRVLTADGSAHLSFIEWQDGQTDEAFKIVLPSKVVSKLANHIDATNARNRSRVSRRNSNPNAFGNYRRAALDVDNPQHPFTVISGDEEEQIS